MHENVFYSSDCNQIAMLTSKNRTMGSDAAVLEVIEENNQFQFEIENLKTRFPSLKMDQIRHYLTVYLKREGEQSKDFQNYVKVYR